MAISATHYQLLHSIKDKLPQGGSILEIGEANFYGDFDLHALPDWPADLKAEAIAAVENGDMFTPVKRMYDFLFSPTHVVAFDMDGPTAIKADLNNHFLWANDNFQLAYDAIINHGTAEHVFDVANVFRQMHLYCKHGGLLIHESPCTGWLDHGFYNLQPTLFWDIADANCYDIELFAIEDLATRTAIIVSKREDIHALKREGRLADNAMVFVVFRKSVNDYFKLPTQGVYANTVSQKVQEAWQTLR